MPPLFKFFIRLILIIVICSFYLKYRNNQCIINQNCKPYFISHILSPKIKFTKKYFVLYKIENKTPSIQARMERTSLDKELEKDDIFNKNENNFIRNLVQDFNKNYYYSDLNIVRNNDIIVKKITLNNDSNVAVKVFPKMTFNSKYFKIYNCFCGSKIVMEPMSYKDIYIYFQFKEPDLNEMLRKKIKSKIVKTSQDLINDDFTIKISL
jgi:hypothetical protein